MYSDNGIGVSCVRFMRKGRMRVKKVLVLIAVLAIAFVVLPFATFAGAGMGSVVFKNSETNAPICELDGNANVNADISFVPSKSGKAKIMTVAYDGDNRMLGEAKTEEAELTEGVKFEHTTQSFSAKDADSVKVLSGWQIL